MVGGVAGLLLIAILTVLLMKRRRQQQLLGLKVGNDLAAQFSDAHLLYQVLQDVVDPSTHCSVAYVPCASMGTTGCTYLCD